MWVAAKNPPAAFSDRKLRPLRENLSLRVPGPPSLSLFGRMSREDHRVVWPVLIFVGAIGGLLALDDSLWGLFESALALYGPLVMVLGGYVLFKSAVHGVRLIGNQSCKRNAYSPATKPDASPPTLLSCRSCSWSFPRGPGSQPVRLSNRASWF
jgi:hypothetical protein